MLASSVFALIFTLTHPGKGPNIYTLLHITTYSVLGYENVIEDITHAVSLIVEPRSDNNVN